MPPAGFEHAIPVAERPLGSAQVLSCMMFPDDGFNSSKQGHPAGETLCNSMTHICQVANSRFIS